MGFFEALIRALLYLCVLAICFFLTLWVLGAIGIAIPAIVVTILKVMFVLIAILILVRLLWPFAAGITLWPSR
jgi:hypothetical protein